MQDALVILVKAAVGGTLVVAFALLGEILRPKWLAGLFSAAPSIAIAGLIVTVVDKGNQAASQAALGMTFGAAGFVAFAACVRPLLARFHTIPASAVACVAWVAVAVGSYLLTFR